MSFTIHQDKKVDKMINLDLRLIVEGILVTLKEKVVSIILTGGFGRGEGGVLIENGKIIPFNDYDLVVITKPLLPFLRYSYLERLKILSKDLEKGLNIAVDLGLVEERKLKSLPYTMFWYETRMGYKVLWGNGNLLSMMPNYDPKDFPLEEGTRLLLNRGVLLLMSKQILMNDKTLPLDKKKQIINWCLKAIQACGDCVLIAYQKYHHSYQEREKIFASLDLTEIPYKERIFTFYKEAIDFKLKPNFDSYLGKDLDLMVEDTINTHEIFFKWFEEKRLKRNFSSWFEYVQHTTKFPPAGGLRQGIAYFVRNLKKYGFPRFFETRLLCSYWEAPEEKLLSALPLLLYEPISDENLFTASKVLNDKSNQRNWNDLSTRLISVWN